MSQHILLFVVFATVTSSLYLQSQPIETNLPGLVWVDTSWAYNSTLASIIKPNHTGFVLGWNWVAPYSPLGRMMHTTMFHVGDGFSDTQTRQLMDPLQRAVRDSYVNGMTLVPCVRGISDALDTMLTGLRNPLYGNPGIAIGFEYAPWLDYSTTTSDVVLEHNDVSRSVAGFRFRATGNRTGDGSSTDPYRWELAPNTSGQSAFDLVLDQPTLDTAWVYEWDDRSQQAYTAPNLDTATNYDRSVNPVSVNTEVLRVCVTLRRTEADQPGSDTEDVILRIRVPYAVGTKSDTIYQTAYRNDIPAVGQGRQYINFAFLPPNSLPPLFNNPNGMFGTQQAVPTGRLSSTNTQPMLGFSSQVSVLEIRRGMLPAIANGRAEEATIYAEYFCDYKNTAGPQNHPINNRRFPARYRGVGPDEISRMGLEVWYNRDSATGLGVEIRSLRIETPHMTNFLFGQHDEQIRTRANTFVQRINQRLNRRDSLTPTVIYSPPAGVDTVRPISIWRFYGYDEPAPVHWLAFRRLNTLLDGLLITEVNAEHHDKQMHIMGQRTFWQGAGFNTSPEIASYTYNWGWSRWSQTVALPNFDVEPGELYWRRSYAGLKYGLLNLRYRAPAHGAGNTYQFTSTLHTDATFQDDPDTFLEWRAKDTLPLSLPIQQNEPLFWNDRSTHTLPFVQWRYLDQHPDQAGGIIGSLEARMRVSYRDQATMLWGIDPARPNTYIPWIANIWPQYYLAVQYGDDFTPPQPGSAVPPYHWAAFGNQRPKTATEMRLSYWMPIVLGAKGVMIYKGITSDEQGATSLDTIPYASQNHPHLLNNEPNVSNFELGMGLAGNKSGELMNNGPLSFHPYANKSDTVLMTDNSVSAEWFTNSDTTNSVLFFINRTDRTNTALEELVDSLDGPGQRSNATQQNTRVYAGGISMRVTAREVTNRVTAMDSLIGRSRDTVGDHILTRLRLRAWYGKGFSTIDCQHPNNTPAQRLSHFFDTATIATRLKTRHVRRFRDRVSHSDIPGHFDYDAPDSVFADITLHAIDGTQMDSVFALGVLNRRTDPRLPLPRTSFNVDTLPNNHSNWEFVSHDAYLSEVASNPELAYAQRGARQITIPFNYKPSSGGYKLLRLQEMGGGIDTIIGQDRELAVDFLPGEGKMFRVTVLEGEKPADMQGWLAHNTQRKVVVYPTLVKDTADTIGMSPGSPAPERTLYDPLTLQDPICGRMDTLQPQQYYRAREDGGFRYHIVYHMKADSNALLRVYYRRSQLLASDNNSAASVDTAGIYNPRIVWEEPIALDTFIRQDGLMFGQTTNCGYPSLVVRDDPNLPPHMNPCVYVVYACQSPGPEDIAICEARLAANAATHAMQAQLYTSMRSSVLAYSMAYPSCPAEYADRLRNWGTPVVGATIGGNFYAWSDVRQGIIVGFKKPEATFFTNGTLQVLKMHAGGSVVAQFPSLPSYTKMAIGEDDIPLVWQEGTIGRSIGEGSCTEGEHILYTRLFHNGDTVQHRLVARGTYPGILPVLQAQNNILRLTPLSTPVQTNYNRKPTIYRQMSEYDDAGMSLSNPLRSYGYVNHKADRIAWEHNVMYLTEPPEYDPEAPAPLPGPALRHWQIDRMSIDCWDSCRSAAVPNKLWHSAISSVYYLDVDLRNPELVQGEQKTVLGTQVSSPQIASSWAYGDTSVVLSFNSENHPGMGPHVYHMTFVDGYYRDQAVLVGTINNLGWAALDVTMRNAQGALQGERMPHVAARHSIVHSPSLLKNRRFSESALQLDVSAVYSNALYLPTPDIDRSTRGFFKETDDVFIPRDRIWRGYRSDQFDALLSDILIGGKHYSLLWDDTTTSARMHTAWFDAEDIIEIELKTQTQGASATMAQAKLERQSDGEFIELPVLGVRGQMLGSGPSREPLQYQWTVLTDPNERYRLVLATTDPEALPAEDVEMSAHKEPFARSSLSSGARQMGMIDGYTMRMIKDTIPAERIHVWPHPATDEVTLMCRTTATSRTPQLGAGGIVPLDIYNLAGELVATTTAHVASNGVISSRMAVSSLDEGFYTIVARSRYPMLGMMVVQR